VTQNLTHEEWEAITVTAIALGLAPLLHWRLIQADVPVPPLAMAKLALTRQAHAKRNQAIARQLAELLAACAHRQLEVMVLKGALLAFIVYPEAALRPMNDIDLLFKLADLGQVGSMLEELGYAGKHKSADQGPGVTKHLSTYRRVGPQAATPNPYLSAEADRMVEPHSSLEESWFGLKVDITPGVWPRAVPISLQNQPAYRLSAADLLLHLTVHATFHVIMGAAVFVQLYDIGQVIKTWSDEVDWAQVHTLARQAGAQPFVYAGLYWARTLYGADVPPAALSALEKECPANLVVYVQSLDAGGIFRRTQQPPLTSLPQRLQRGFFDRRETARWAATIGQKWQVWQTAVAVHKTDTARLLRQGLKAQS
jgi:hypothetical protein